MVGEAYAAREYVVSTPIMSKHASKRGHNVRKNNLCHRRISIPPYYIITLHDHTLAALTSTTILYTYPTNMRYGRFVLSYENSQPWYSVIYIDLRGIVGKQQ